MNDEGGRHLPGRAAREAAAITWVGNRPWASDTIEKMLRRWVLASLTLVLLGLASLWATLAISMSLYDSMDRYRNPSWPLLTWDMFLALSPTWLACWLLFRVWHNLGEKSQDHESSN